MLKNKLEQQQTQSMTTNININNNSHIMGLYDLEKTIGQGHFAIVKSARHIFSGERVAIKIIDKLKLDNVSREHLFQEVKCMKLVQHPNVVRLYEVIDTPSKLYLVLEFGDGGDMYDYIMKHSNGLTENKAKLYFSQIVRAIKYCHDLRVVHRDLKPENVVFFQQTGQVKLTDFGFSNVFDPNNKLLTSCGSLAYSAPEILLGDSYYAPPVDVWSLGVILYMLVTGRAPFQEANDSETLTMILDCKYILPDYLSHHCSDLISRMLLRDPAKRISLAQICKHDWLGSSVEDFSDLEDSEINEDVCLVKRELIGIKDNEDIIRTMVEGGIAVREEIESALDKDVYNYATATYYLLAERLLRNQFLMGEKKKKKKIKIFNLPVESTKRKVLTEINQQSVAQTSSVLSKNQFNTNILKMQQRNLLLRQDEAKEEDEEELEVIEVSSFKKDEPKPGNTNHEDSAQIISHLTNINEDEEEEEEDPNKPTLAAHLTQNTTRRSSRGAILSQTSDNIISKLTIPEEETELEHEASNSELYIPSLDYLNHQRRLSPTIIKSLRDEAYLKLNKNLLQTSSFDDTKPAENPEISTSKIQRIKQSRMSSSGADTSDSETEANKQKPDLITVSKDYDWNRSASSSSRSRSRLRSSQFNRPLSVSSETADLGPNQSQAQAQAVTSPNSNGKTLSVEHRLANMSQMSISSQLSKNNSFRYHRSTLTGSETPNQLFNQQLSSTTPTPRESIVFNRGDEKPIAKILLQQQQSLKTGLNDAKSKSFDLSDNGAKQTNSLIQAKVENYSSLSSTLRQNNESYSKAIKQSATPVRPSISIGNGNYANQRLNFSNDYDLVCDEDEDNRGDNQGLKSKVIAGGGGGGKKHSSSSVNLTASVNLNNNNNGNNKIVKSNSNTCSKCCTIL